MADEKEKSGNGILKAVTTSLVGMLSGAVIMYVSPLVNSAIKPPKPVPNFSYSLDGVTATFNNRSTGGAQGWWDYGDGSALEPFSPNQAAIAHKFPGAGSYTVKLLLHNLIGEEVERSAPVKIEAQTPPPTIDDFQVTAITANRSGSSQYPTAPATFRITSKLKNADLVIWSIDDQPLELVNDAGQGSLERFVTFANYGSKKIRLMAVSGKNKIEKEADVWVDVPSDEPMILVQQNSYAATAKTIPFSVSFPAQFGGATYPFEVSRALGPDSTILEADFDPPSAQLVRNAKLAISPDKRGFTITGNLLRQNGSGNVPASWFGKVDLKVAHRSAAGAKRCDPVSATLQLPGRTVVALSPAASELSAGLEWELRQGMDVIHKDTKVPFTQLVTFREKTFRVTVSTVGTQMQIDAAVASPPSPFLNTSSPRIP